MRPSAAALLVGALLLGIAFCPCPSEETEHAGCASRAETSLRELKAGCCDDAVPSAALIAPPLPPAVPDVAGETVAETRGEVVQAAHAASTPTRPLVLRI
jgi:hypothetical protein